MFTKKDYKRNQYMLEGSYKKEGYDWWWHSFTGINEKTGEQKPFFIEFFIINPKISPNKVQFGKLNNEDNKPCYLMIKCGAWGEGKKQLNKYYPIKDVTIKKGKIFEVIAGNDFLSENEIRIDVNVDKEAPGSDLGSFKANLKITKVVPFNVGYGASTFFRKLKAFQMYWHASGMKSYFEGEVYFDNQKYIISKDTCYGYADKNWGKDFTSPWVWLSSNNLFSEKHEKKLENSVFDIGGGCPKAFGIKLPRKLLSAFYYEGKCYEYNFSKFWTHTKTYFKFEESDDMVKWEVVQTNRNSKMITNICCYKKDMLLIKYESPKGEFNHNHLFNGGNGFGEVKLFLKKKKEYVLLDNIIVNNVGCEYGEYNYISNKKSV